MIDKWIIQGKTDNPVGCILALPGRGIPGSVMERFMYYTGLWRSLQVILEPEGYQWYPAPNGPEDQTEAIGGLAASRDLLERQIERIQKAWGFKKEQIGLTGFSAGGVMAIQMLAYSDAPYAGVFSMGGAILDPKALPKAKHKTPVLLQHNRDDDCFKWDERYVPMKEAMLAQGYNMEFSEGWEGGHNITQEEVHLARKFFSKLFGYWQDFEEIESVRDGEPPDDDDADVH